MKKNVMAIMVVFLFTSLPFAEALAISGVRTTDITDKSATVEWQTDEAADGVVTFGKSASELNQAKGGLVLNQSHAVRLPVDKGMTYLFKVKSSTAQTSIEDDNKGQLYSFSTAATDTFPPLLKVQLPSTSSKARIDIVGETEERTELQLFLNNQLVRAYQSTNGKVEFFGVTLKPDGENIVRIEALDSGGNTNAAQFTVLVDLVPPEITLDELSAVGQQTSVTVAGTVTEKAMVQVVLNDEVVLEQDTITFSVPLGLEEGKNNIVVIATDKAGNSDREEREISIDTVPPEFSDVVPLEDDPFYYEGRAIDDVRGKTEPGATVYMYVAGIFVKGRTQEQPELGTLKDLAQYKTSADAEGNFQFKDVDFEHPGVGIDEVTPQEVQAGTEGLHGDQFAAELQQDERAVFVYLAAVDGVGLNTVQQHQVFLGSCFSGFFDFSVKALPTYQTPTLLSPRRLDSGNEIVSFVLSMDYLGQAGKNFADPKAKDKEDDFYEIMSVDLQPNCRDSRGSGLLKGGFFDRHPSYKLACEILKGRPVLPPRPLNPEKTNWYFRYNLGATEKFTNTSKDFWKQFKKSELRFPLKVTVNYREKLRGKSEQPSKAQTMCREVSYSVDIPIDPRKVLPDGLLENSQKALNETITVLNKVIPPLEETIKYVGIGCMATFGLRFILQIYRRFQEHFEYTKCQVLDKVPGQSADDKCPIKTQDQLAACFFIKDGEKDPYPTSALGLPKGVTCPAPKTSEKSDIELNDKMMKHFSGTVNAWKIESKVYKGYRFLCDRIFCHSAPAGWTQEASVQYLLQRKFEEAQCGATASNVRTLVPRQNCFEEFAKKQGVITVATRSEIRDDTCYALGNAVYIIDDKAGGSCTGVTSMKRVDKQEITQLGKVSASAPNVLCAVQEGNTYYTSDIRECKAVCESTKGWKVAPIGTNGCATPADVKAAGKIYYPAGPTKDCWIGNGQTKEHQCYCFKESKDAKNADLKENTGAKYAGLEKGQANSEYLVTKPAGGGTPPAAADDEPEGEWPWNYREAQLYRTSGQKHGIYYPKERYYSGRDFMSAFGANYLLDYIFQPPTTPAIDAHTDHIGAFQTLCLTGIRARLVALRSILLGVNNCLKQIQATGKADAGVCKELFSQFLCSLVYKVFTLAQSKCIGQPFQGAAGQDVDDVENFFKSGSAAVTETMDDTVADVHEEYGNAQLDQLLEGGSQNMMKKVCLAAFGMDVGFDLNNFLDAAYSVPFTTSVSVFSSEGAVGRREFLSFDPVNANSVYEYRTAWVIFPGCELESYQVELAAVTQKEAREHKNINCGAVGDRQKGGNGCDNWNGQAEQRRLFFNGNRVQQGIYVDQNGASNEASAYRYDHFKITLNVDGKQDKSKCLPAENKNGVFYFPIKDATAKDIAQCSIDAVQGQFKCTFGDANSLGQYWIEDLSCWDPQQSIFRRCNAVVLSVDDHDQAKAQATLFSSGQSLICLEATLETQNGRKFPDPPQKLVIPGVGRAGSIPIELNFIPALEKDHFSGSTISVQGECGYDTSPVDNAPSSVTFDPSPVTITFEKGSSGYAIKLLKVADKSNISIARPPGYTLEDIGSIKNRQFQLKKGATSEFSESELKSIVYQINGYGVTNVFPRTSSSSRVECKFITPPQTSAGVPDQTWRIRAKLFYPDDQNQCSEASQPVVGAAGLAFDVDKTVEIKVRDKKVSTPLQAAYDRGKKLYTTALGERNNRKQYELFRSAVAEFQKVALAQPPPEGSREEFMSYWWSVVAMMEMRSLKKTEATATGATSEAKKEYNDLRALILGTVDAFTGRFDRNTKLKLELQQSPEIKVIRAYIEQIKETVKKENDVQ